MATQAFPSLVHLLDARAAEDPDRVLYTFVSDTGYDPSWSRRHLHERARSIASTLRLTVRRGDRALLLYPPGTEFIAAFMGCLGAGVIAVPAYPPDPSPLSPSINRLEIIVRDSSASICLTTARIAQALPKMGSMAVIATDELAAQEDADELQLADIDRDTVAFLQELLRTPGVEVLALVRDAADPVQAMARLHRSLEKLGIPEDEWMGRVRPIVGDLSKPLLGLTGKVFEALANSVERIYHNGAVVNMVLPYHTLKPANVDGTREILRLSARAGGSIPVHYISSLATLYLMRPDHPQTEIPLSFDDLDQELLRSASGGYGVSKFVAEQLVSQSGQAGIPSIIYRVGSVTGHSQTGAANTGDFLHAMLRGALQLGCLPRDVRLDPVPVDFVTRAIAHLASTDPPSGSIFHITNPRPMEVDQFVAWAENRGFPIALVDRKTWLRRINEQAARDGHNLQSFSALLQMLVDYQGLHRFMQAKIRQPDMSNTSRGLAATDISCPPVTSDLLDTYLEHFLRTGFIADHSQAPRPRSSQPRGEQ